MSADVTEEVKKMTESLVKRGIYKSQSEVVRDAIRQLAYKYGVGGVASLREVRVISAKATKKSGKSLSRLVRESRDEK